MGCSLLPPEAFTEVSQEESILQGVSVAMLEVGISDPSQVNGAMG